MKNETEMRVITPENSPGYLKEWGFSQGIECNGFLFVSGCTGTMDSGVVPDGIVEQTRVAFEKIEMCLSECGVGFSSIVEMTTYHVGLQQHIKEFISAKSSYFVEPYPAWTAIGVSELATSGALVEIRV